jgi:hypothetical protein
MISQVILPRVLSLLGLPLVPFVRRFLSEDPEADTVALLSDFGWLQSSVSFCDMNTSASRRTSTSTFSSTVFRGWDSSTESNPDASRKQAAAASDIGSAFTDDGDVTTVEYTDGIAPVPAPLEMRQKRRELLQCLERMQVDIGHLVDAFKLTCKKSLTRR